MAYDFNKIASNYDRLNHIMTLGMDRLWRRRSVKRLISGFIHKPKVLDIACGTGDMMVELTTQGCDVIGVDLSEEMLAIAAQKCKAPTMIADAEQLPFPDASFDAVTCAFGIRNFVHLEKGLSEMSRVLKPSGQLVLIELATPDSPLVRPFYNLYTRHIIPQLGKRLAGNREAYTYLPTSIERFPKGKAMLSKLYAAGFQPQEHKYFFGVCRLYHCQLLPQQ